MGVSGQSAALRQSRLHAEDTLPCHRREKGKFKQERQYPNGVGAAGGISRADFHRDPPHLGQKRCASCHCASATAWPAMAHASLDSIGIRVRRSPITTSSSWQVVLRNLHVCEWTIHCQGKQVTHHHDLQMAGRLEEPAHVRGPFTWPRSAGRTYTRCHQSERSCWELGSRMRVLSSLNGTSPSRGTYLRKACLQPDTSMAKVHRSSRSRPNR